MSGTPLSPLKQALLAIEQLQQRLDAQEYDRREPIAVIGIGCRFPGHVSDPDGFWRLLTAGTDAIVPVPADRWDAAAYVDPDASRPGKIVTGRAGFLDRVDGFDAQFFGIAPREAAAMDPQQRLLLEVAWEALEHAGQAPDSLVGSPTGVFVGLVRTDYATLALRGGDATSFGAYYASGIAHSVAAGRLSYVLGLQGPSVSVDTACSSSLVAVHLACQSLRMGESRMALAGGVSLMLSPENSIAFSQARFLGVAAERMDVRHDQHVAAHEPAEEPDEPLLP